MRSIRVASLFAGVGGICLGFQKAGYNVIWANEIDKKACRTYKANFGDNYLVEGDIRKIHTESIPDFEVLVAGFPCQAFSIAGYRKGFHDERGNLFFEILRIIREKRPRAIFLENVKNLENHDKGRTFSIIERELHKSGFMIKKQILNTSEYANIPQNRERIYIVGFRTEKDLEKFEFPLPTKLTKKIDDVIARNEQKPEKYYYRDTSPYYEMLRSSINNLGTVYQIRRVYIRENKNNVCPTLTANMGGGGHNVPIIKDKFGIRKLTPKECFAFQGFPDDFILPVDVSDTSLYKQAGNSVSVPVVYKIANQMRKAIRDGNS